MMTMTPALYIGTSGWNYDSWRAGFYGHTPGKGWLRFCAARFTGIEVNATFYRLQTKNTFRRWRDATPREFRFAIKASRYLTHNRKLTDPLAAIRLEREHAAVLDKKLAAVVWQLPRRFGKNMSRLEGFCRALRNWRVVRHAIEFRDASWFDNEVADCLRHYGIAICQSDAAVWPLWDAVTTDMVYVRLYGHETTYVSGYTEQQLREWAARARRWRRRGCTVHIYFDNDALGYAPLNAMRMLEMTGFAVPA
jgi:uncharacterized protein YecE (DUF72 family)